MKIDTHTNANGETYYSTTDENGQTIYSFSEGFEDTWTQEDEDLYGAGSKTATRTADVTLTLKWDASLPNVLSIDGPHGLVGDDIYFSECDGERINSLATAFIDQLPKGAKIETNGKNEAWVSHWDEKALKSFDGRAFSVRFTQTCEVDEDGDEVWLENSATLIA
jgi:hypothetical protein